MSNRAPKRFRLSEHYWTKRIFNPIDPTDLKEYQYFLKHSRWKDGCPFIMEWPHLTVTDMIQKKLISHYLGSMISQVQDKDTEYHVKKSSGTKTQSFTSQSQPEGASRTVRRGQPVHA